MSNTFPSFEVFFKKVVDGDKDAFWDLIQDPEYKKIIKVGLAGFRLNRTEAEDIRSEFDVRLFKGLPRAGHVRNPRAYLRSSIRNFYISQWRKFDSKNVSLDEIFRRRNDGLGTKKESSFIPFSELPAGRRARRNRGGQCLSLKGLSDEQIRTAYDELPEKTRTGVENTARFVRIIHDVGARYLENQTPEKFARSYELIADLEKSLFKIWGYDPIKALSKFRSIEGKKVEYQRYLEILIKYPAIGLLNALNRVKERAFHSSSPMTGGWDFSFYLIFDRQDQLRSFFKLRISPSRLFFDVLAKVPAMRKGKYLDLRKIGIAMIMTGHDGTLRMDNLRQYRYRMTSHPRLYKQVVNRIYKRSFIDQINIELRSDISYQIMKEGRQA